MCQKGGGTQHITDWHRNLYGDIGVAPAVNEDELLCCVQAAHENGETKVSQRLSR